MMRRLQHPLSSLAALLVALLGLAPAAGPDPKDAPVRTDKPIDPAPAK